jgi:hypothetical protein
MGTHDELGLADAMRTLKVAVDNMPEKYVGSRPVQARSAAVRSALIEVNDSLGPHLSPPRWLQIVKVR